MIEQRPLARGPEVGRVEAHLAASGLDSQARESIWHSADRILARGPAQHETPQSATGIAVGYVQSGKTTSFTSLIALAADAGYRITIAMLGSTTLLLEQNRERLLTALDLNHRRDYKWLHFENPSLNDVSPREFSHYLSRGRNILITLLKHYGRIDDLTAVLTHEAIGSFPALIVDDEADQISLNTRVRQGEESSTYRAIGSLRSRLSRHLYVQYTATPYAPFLLQVEDFLSPDFVELLKPGTGYVGGRELLVENRSVVVREIDDAPGPSAEPPRLPASLRAALGEFVVGAALLLNSAGDGGNAPVSMLVHPTGRRDPQRRYEFHIERCLKAWRSDVRATLEELEPVRKAMVATGAEDIHDLDFERSLELVINEAKLWRVNSDEDAHRLVKWNVSPVHILIGGNKLDRGFTVEGLTVSWLGRSASNQLDTMVQRARAYGYRGRHLPYCRIYGSQRTIEALEAGVETELDMRAQLREWIDQGKPASDWAAEVGLVLGAGLQPTRSQVIEKVMDFRPGWHLMARPATDEGSTRANWALIERLGLTEAEHVTYGRLRHRTLEVDAATARETFIDNWQADNSPGWDAGGVSAWLRRLARTGVRMTVVLLSGEEEEPRIRAWDEQLGFEQLMQGRDPVQRDDAYPGDRSILPAIPQIQVHHVKPRDAALGTLLALAAYVPKSTRIIRRKERT